MKCPHCGQLIGGVLFRCSRCRAEVGEAALRSAAGVRTALCAGCREKKRAEVVEAKRRRRESGIQELAAPAAPESERKEEAG